jgi:hypothetical protein
VFLEAEYVDGLPYPDTAPGLHPVGDEDDDDQDEGVGVWAFRDVGGVADLVPGRPSFAR